ncbi:YqaE/Pmp3 family membrane protein [Bacillus sp. ISL-46]|uniref:YqaE/Pmp3 family membrane protein n=1 Tax=Bacillus sp. ISL-46 TaxID=2819129 RepID=UPI001BE98A5D|nr:YqaE/Pmp3 family membrane protein [Bacillus sp. ISL-46]MBT2723060.1 YqaE/Pmp3 family membrane protein [Bacillus sp. ISL-46]
MLYLLAIVFPPVAVLMVGKPIQALINLVLCLFFYVPGIIHALFVVNEKKADRRMKKQAELIAKANRNH